MGLYFRGGAQNKFPPSAPQATVAVDRDPGFQHSHYLNLGHTDGSIRVKIALELLK